MESVDWKLVDMHGIVYRYSRVKGITLVDKITQEDAVAADEIFKEACGGFNVEQGRKYDAGIEYLADHEKGLKNVYWALDDAMTRAVLYGRSDVCGLELNMSAVRFILDAVNSSHQHGIVGSRILIASSTMISDSKAVLEETLSRYFVYEASGGQLVPERGSSGSLAFNLSDIGISICDLTQYGDGDKKTPETWEAAIRNQIMAPNPRKPITISAVVEDDPKKCDAAAEGVRRVTNMYPLRYHEIGPEGLVNRD